MGVFFPITCRNKDCKYNTTLYFGPGMMGFVKIRRLQESIMSGETEVSDEIMDLLNNGHSISSVHPHICNTCHEYVCVDTPFIFEVISASPYGTIREYKVHYVFDTPYCPKCNSKLEFILNPKSSKSKCPQCGSDNMKVGEIGYRD